MKSVNTGRLIGKEIKSVSSMKDLNRDDPIVEITLCLSDGSNLTIRNADWTLEDPVACPTCGKDLA
jgi:hypothetical protein